MINIVPQMAVFLGRRRRWLIAWWRQRDSRSAPQAGIDDCCWDKWGGVQQLFGSVIGTFLVEHPDVNTYRCRHIRTRNSVFVHQFLGVCFVSDSPHPETIHYWRDSVESCIFIKSSRTRSCFYIFKDTWFEWRPRSQVPNESTVSSFQRLHEMINARSTFGPRSSQSWKKRVWRLEMR